VNFLLDTNVISEWVKSKPDRNVVTWLAEADEDRVFVSVISFAEIRRGIELMVAGRRRERLVQWLAEELPLRFEERILSVDQGGRRPLGRGHGAKREERPRDGLDGRLCRRDRRGSRSHAGDAQHQRLRTRRDFFDGSLATASVALIKRLLLPATKSTTSAKETRTGDSVAAGKGTHHRTTGPRYR
jgi:predicted nucleic acid-binding protein